MSDPDEDPIYDRLWQGFLLVNEYKVLRVLNENRRFGLNTILVHTKTKEKLVFKVPTKQRGVLDIKAELGAFRNIQDEKRFVDPLGPNALLDESNLLVSEAHQRDHVILAKGITLQETPLVQIIQMPFYDQGDLLDKLCEMDGVPQAHPKRQRFSVPQLGLDLLDGLQVIHESFSVKDDTVGMCHGDISPENILLYLDGRVPQLPRTPDSAEDDEEDEDDDDEDKASLPWRFALIDLGLSDRGFEVAGKDSYIDPWRLTHHCHPRNYDPRQGDLWSLGAILGTAFCDGHFFPSLMTKRAFVWQKLRRQGAFATLIARAGSRISVAWWPLLKALLEPDPKKRPSADWVRRWLTALQKLEKSGPG